MFKMLCFFLFLHFPQDLPMGLWPAGLVNLNLRLTVTGRGEAENKVQIFTQKFYKHWMKQNPKPGAHQVQNPKSLFSSIPAHHWWGVRSRTALRAARQWLTHPCAINAVSSTDPKHGTGQGPMKKINSIPPKPNTPALAELGTCHLHSAFPGSGTSASASTEGQGW